MLSAWTHSRISFPIEWQVFVSRDKFQCILFPIIWQIFVSLTNSSTYYFQAFDRYCLNKLYADTQYHHNLLHAHIHIHTHTSRYQHTVHCQTTAPFHHHPACRYTWCLTLTHKHTQKCTHAPLVVSCQLLFKRHPASGQFVPVSLSGHVSHLHLGDGGIQRVHNRLFKLQPAQLNWETKTAFKPWWWHSACPPPSFQTPACTVKLRNHNRIQTMMVAFSVSTTVYSNFSLHS